MDIVSRAEQAGVKTADGRPLAGRLSRKLVTVILHAAECEPLLDADRVLLTRYPEQVLEGLTLALEATEASRGFVAVRNSDKESLKAMARARRRFAHVLLAPVEDFYPSGEPRGLVREVLGDPVPPGMSQEAVGVMVLDPHAAFHLAAAQEHRPVTHRFVSVAGEVRRPGTLRLPIGLPVGEAVALCGGIDGQGPVRYVAGGPLTGRIVTGEAPIEQTTAAILVLPEHHPVVARKQVSIDVLLKRAASVCEGCRVCTDRCAQHLLGYAIEPHLLMRGLVHRLGTIPEVVTGAAACTGCLVCEAVCPANLAPGRLYQAVAADLKARRVMLPMRATLSRSLDGAREARRMPVLWLERRLGVSKYAGVGSVDDNYLTVPRVRLPLDGAAPCVEVGATVSPGMLVAEPGVRGVRIHAPIDGVVHAIDDVTNVRRMLEIRSVQARCVPLKEGRAQNGIA